MIALTLLSPKQAFIVPQNAKKIAKLTKPYPTTLTITAHLRWCSGWLSIRERKSVELSSQIIRFLNILWTCQKFWAGFTTGRWSL